MKSAFPTANRALAAICVTIALWAAPACAGTLPPDPDNAALLYYQAMATDCHPTDMATSDALYARISEAVPDEVIREYVKQWKEVLDLMEGATRIPKCNWGLRYSRGMELGSDVYPKMRDLTLLLRAGARIRAVDGDYRGALERCLAMRRFAGHVGDDTLLLYLQGRGFDMVGLVCIQDVLGCMPVEEETLAWFVGRLAAEPGPVLALGKALEIDLEMAVQVLRNRDITLAYLREGTMQDSPDNACPPTDEQLIARVRAPYDAFLSSVLRVLAGSMAYADKYTAIQTLTNTVEEEFLAAPQPKVYALWPPPVPACYQLQVRHEAQVNAVKAAIEIYLVAAQTRQLPKRLPDFLPKDPYSGEDFEYIVTADGFTLRCRGKEIDAGGWIPGCDRLDRTADCIADKVHEYNFKVLR